MPALVVAMAANPASASTIALPASQAFGITKPVRPSWSRRKAAAWRAVLAASSSIILDPPGMASSHAPKVYGGRALTHAGRRSRGETGREPGWRPAAERGQLGESLCGPVGQQQHRAGALEPGADAIPSGQGFAQRVPVLVETSPGAEQAGRGPRALRPGGRRGCQPVAGVGQPGDDGDLGGD